MNQRWLLVVLVCRIAACRFGPTFVGGALLILTPAILQADVGQEEYDLAMGLFRQKRWDFATKRLDLFLKNYPDHEKVPLAKFYLGMAYVYQQDYRAARTVLRDFVKTEPKNAHISEGRYRVAECSFLIDDTKAAQAELEEFLQEHPKDPLAERAMPYLGDVQLRLGQPDAALATFDQAIREFPQGVLIDDVRFGRAKALENLQRVPEAIQQYEELAANDENPRAAEAQFELAARQFDGKQFAEAATAYRKLLERFPKSPLAPSARLNIGYSLYQNGQFGEAAQQFAEAQGDTQNLVTAQYWRGLSLKSMGDYAQAETVLTDASKTAGELPLAEAIHFQRAICARRLNENQKARALFIRGAEEWPKGEYADDCLHAAAELAVDDGDLEEATKLLDRFAKDYPGSGLRLHYELLQGRVELAQAALAIKNQQPATEVTAAYQRAEARFSHVLQSSSLVRTQFLARYYLAITWQLQNRHEEVVQVLVPVVQAIEQDPSKLEFGEVLLIEAESFLALKQYEPAQLAADKYLKLFPDGRQTPRVLSVVAIAGDLRGDNSGTIASQSAMKRMIDEFRDHPLTPSVLLQLAEASEKSENWKMAAARYATLAEFSADTENHAFALRGLAWSEFQQKEFSDAAQNYDRVLKEFPQHPLAAECSYYRAESLREDNQLEQALAAYEETFQRYGPSTPAAAGAEQETPLLFAYRAGLQRARTLRRMQKPIPADAAYEKLLVTFPHPVHLDHLLDEWALLNYETENFSRSDELFRRLIRETPDSDLADNARLSLAESDLLNDRFAEAKQSFEQLFASDKSDAEVKERSLYQLVAMAVGQKRWADVQPLAERLQQDFPQSEHIAYAQVSEVEAILANPQASEDKLNFAKQRLQAVVQSAGKELPKDAFQGRAWVLLAEIAYRAKDYPEVLRIVTEFHEAQPQSDYLYQAEEVLGRSYKQQADFPEARAAFERVLNDPVAVRTPTAAKSQFLIAETYFLEENWEQAFLAYQKVYASYNHPEWQSAALLQSGKCDEKLDHWKESVATYERLLNEFPNSEWAAEAKQRLEVARVRAEK